ncbi:THO complex subunit 3, partial [Dimargaris verticillata]
MTVGSPFTSQRMVFLRGHRGSVRDIQWNCEGKKLATAAADKLIRVWNPERRIDPHYTTELRGHTDAISGLTWDPADPDRLASVGYDKLLCIWDTK